MLKSIFALLLCVLVHLAKGLTIPAGNITRRDVTASQLLNDFRSAQLVISSTQTSCEMALVNSISAFVAASCLKFKSDGNADNSIDYRVAINDPNSGTSKIYSVDSVDVHSQYNPSTFANNIAFLMFNTGSSVSWKQYIGEDPADWDNVYYTSRTLSSISKATWNTPAIIETSGASASDEAGCTAASALYSSNTASMRCLSTSATSVANNKCNTPYGAAWAIFQPSDIAIGALYSYSVVYGGNSLCGSSGNQFHYYTLLQPYVAWGQKMLGASISTYAADSSFSYSGSTSFSLSNSGAGAVSGTTLVSGDQYPTQKTYTGSSSASNTNAAPPTPAVPSQSTPSTGGSNGGSTGGGSTGGGNTGGGSTGGGSSTGGNAGSTDTGSNNSGSSSNGGSSSSSTKPSSTGNSSDNASATDTGDGSSDSGDSNNKEDGNGDSPGFSVIDGGNGSFDYGDSSSGIEAGSGVVGEPVLDNPDASDKGGSGYNGLGRTATIIVATVVPIATILILVGLFFLYRWYRRYRNKFSWDPKSEAANIDRIRIIDEIAVNSSPETDHRQSHLRQSTPPSYDDHQFEGIATNFEDKIHP
ncbi:hypothetical protein EV178_005027 [Coemansia sp. RSA 1646]|nr:hypothetical protein EV178_005027 [Coemansia sp. RSA 1646]KAJ1772369.1 hypothetical protein LPJ74_001459 [Coemansia sp. RSA 1843]KAJ2212136.1 hypothetical protein EV179_004933 [Coemansia sp. RSA 487]